MEGFVPKHDFLLCVDSDGCVFDVMDLKHQECFCPAFIQAFSLQPISRYARNAWDFVNLYSQTRGIHRLLALLMVMDLLSKRREVRERGFAVPGLPSLRAYVDAGMPLTNDGMEAYLNEHPENSELALVLAWSKDTNSRIRQMVHGVAPFPHARESLAQVSKEADIVVVSATQQAALAREWKENGILPYTSMICGQEQGSKAEIISALIPSYAPSRVLMVGDAPGDRDAAHKNGALFYPVSPAKEAASWEVFLPNVRRFFRGEYAGETEKELIAAFDQLLPKNPSWETV